MSSDSLLPLLPEITLIAAAVVVYLAGAFVTTPRPWRWIGGAALAAAAIALLRQKNVVPTGEPIVLDALAFYGRWLALGAGALMMLVASKQEDRHSCLSKTASLTNNKTDRNVCPPDNAVLLMQDSQPEYVGSLLLAVAGLMLVSVAADLVLLFVALELISIPTYVLLYLGRRDAACQESAAKYFFLSVLASAILLYGFSFVYGVGGSTALGHLWTSPHGFAGLMRLAMLLVFAGLCFKITAVPFHFYAPDVYQGNTYPNAAILSVLPKAAGFIALVRLLVTALPDVAPESWQVVLAVSILTMTLGNVVALWQENLRRLLAYSAIAHGGYMLIGFAVAMASGAAPGDWNGLGALWFYLATYAVATIGVMAALEYLGSTGRRLDAIDELAGLGHTRPAVAAVLAVFLFSLAGVPPLAGFWGKLLIFGGALNVNAQGAGVHGWFLAVAIIGALNAAIAAAYYLRIVAVMYFRTPLATPPAKGGIGAWQAAIFCALVVVGVGLYPGPLMREANLAGGGELTTRRASPAAKQNLVPRPSPLKREPPPQSAPHPEVAAIAEVPAPLYPCFDRLVLPSLLLSGMVVTTSCHPDGK